MPVTYLSTDDAIAAHGLRMVVVGGVPSPWGEGAKGILHVKRIPWSAVRLDYASEVQKAWAGGARNGPVAILDGERPRAGWAEILLLAERLAPAPSLLPADAAERALVFGLAHEILGEGGLAWTRRLFMIDAGLRNSGGFAPRVAGYLARKYGHDAAAAAGAVERIVALLDMLAARLEARHAAGHRYLVGDAPSAADIYLATVLALFRPLPEAHCAMDPATRLAMETRDARTDAALAPVLFEHRDMMYARHLELPLSL